jgi:hypothetical protein
LKMRLSVEQVTSAAELTIEEVEKIKEELMN